MSQMQPALVGLEGMRSLAVLHLHDGMIVTTQDDTLVTHFSMGDILHQCPADATTLTGIDEAILRTGVESVLAIDKLWMQHHVTLLTEGTQVLQTLPVNEVLGACNTCGSGSCRGVEGLCLIVALYAEHTIDVAVFVLGDTHVIDIGGRGIFSVGHRNRLVPEAPLVNAVETLSHSEERLAVGALHAAYQQVATVQFDGTGIEHGIHHDALHQIGVVLLVEVIAPLQGSMLGSQDGIHIFLIDTIATLGDLVGAHEQSLMTLAQGLYFLLIIHSYVILSVCKVRHYLPTHRVLFCLSLIHSYNGA